MQVWFAAVTFGLGDWMQLPIFSTLAIPFSICHLLACGIFLVISMAIQHAHLLCHCFGYKISIDIVFYLEIVMTCTWAQCLFFISIISCIAFSIGPMKQINKRMEKCDRRWWRKAATVVAAVTNEKKKRGIAQEKREICGQSRAFYNDIIGNQAAAAAASWGFCDARCSFWSINHTNANTCRRKC